jgi:hypothetical protein
MKIPPILVKGKMGGILIMNSRSKSVHQVVYRLIITRKVNLDKKKGIVV